MLMSVTGYFSTTGTEVLFIFTEKSDINRILNQLQSNNFA